MILAFFRNLVLPPPSRPFAPLEIVSQAEALNLAGAVIRFWRGGPTGGQLPEDAESTVMWLLLDYPLDEACAKIDVYLSRYTRGHFIDGAGI